MFRSRPVNNSKDYSKPNCSEDQQHPNHPDASLLTNVLSRLYPAARGNSATRTEIQKTGDRSGSLVSNGDPESDSIQSRPDVSRIISMFDRPNASTTAGRHTKFTRIGTGQRSNADVAPSSPIVKNSVDAKNLTSATFFPAESDPRPSGGPVDRWNGSGGPCDDDEDRQSLVESSSDVSASTSGYATDISTDHAVSLPQLLLHNGEPVAEDHPYFVRLAAEAEGPTPILGRSGSFRGFKNLVRAGIASILDKADGKKSVVSVLG